VNAGDVIERVDGDPASDLSLADLRARLRGDPGTVVVLRLKRAGTERDATVVLRDLL
jgi:C-terminal processing protease CtpA/Prc